MGGFVAGVIIFIAASLFLMVWTDSISRNRERHKKIKQKYDGPEYHLKNGDLYFDLDNNEIMFDGETEYYTIPAQAIFKVEAIERFNSESKNGSPIARAVIGDLLAGGVGAIVGVASSSKGNHSIYVRKLSYRLYSYWENKSTKVVELNIAEGLSDTKSIRSRYNDYDEIGDILRDNFGLTIQHVD